MKVKIERNNIIIEEPIITLQDSEKVISLIESVALNHDNIIITLNSSFSFPSNIIGMLERLKDSGKSITILVKDDVLYELFKELNLDKMFNVRKV